MQRAASNNKKNNKNINNNLQIPQAENRGRPPPWA
jgi:hypothetical protein